MAYFPNTIKNSQALPSNQPLNYYLKPSNTGSTTNKTKPTSSLPTLLEQLQNSNKQVK
jgi:hypothetical protein